MLIIDLGLIGIVTQAQGDLELDLLLQGQQTTINLDSLLLLVHIIAILEIGLLRLEHLAGHGLIKIDIFTKASQTV